MATFPEQLDNERIEMKLLLEGLYLKYGYDFRDYAGAHLKRRLEYRRHASGSASYLDMLKRLLREEELFCKVLLDLSVNVTEMFRDPMLYKKIRELVIPHLKTYPFVRSWHAGCSAGQEVYSMCILLHEEGINRNKIQVYATDFSDRILERAQRGVYPINTIREYTANYQKAGGLSSFSDYYTADVDTVIINAPLRERVLFSAHNLATDGVFAEMNIIFCRNVLIYFNKELQNRVVKMFYDSLRPGGFLCLGSKESLRFTEYADEFDVVDERDKIYRKKITKKKGLDMSPGK
ncbi:MAG: protein-glutamate O-methyltransferase CheR [Desulforhopalus sp.]